MDARSEIREFLTTRRARITPEQAGLPAFGGSRRVAGLRREEVALLAGVSVDYYTRLAPRTRALRPALRQPGSAAEHRALRVPRSGAPRRSTPTGGTKRFHHPVVGDLHLTYEVMELVADQGLTMFVYTAEPGSKSEASLRLLGSWAATPDEEVSHGDNEEQPRDRSGA